MRRIRQTLGASGAALLVAGMVAGSGAIAPGRVSAASTPTARAAATMPMLTVTSGATTNRGGVVTVTGSGFMPNESVNITLSGMSGTAATAKADAHGMLPATGISIPYSLKTGSYTITASGANSKHSTSAMITVAKLTPSITISAPSTAPGATETVTGKGFGSKEQITLSLNGEALTTSPSVITTTNGAFTATFSVPKSILRGANAISAIGNESRISSVVSFSGMLTRSPQFYFAGGMNKGTAHSYISLLNTSKQPASVRLTFYFDNGASYTRLTTVPATTQQRVSVSDYGLPQGTFGLVVKSDRQVTAQLSVLRDGQDGDSFLGNTSLGTHWYLAAGSTSGNFHETVSVLNPDTTSAAHVQLQLLTSDHMNAKTVTVSVPAHSNGVFDVNSMLPGKAVSIVAISDRPVVVERTLTFGPDGQGLTTRAGSNKPATNWLFADGTTQNNVQTTFTVLNPGDYAAAVTASFSQQKGVVLGSHSILVPARSRAIITLNNVVQGGGIATVVTSNQAVVVERSEYIGKPDMATAGSVVVGRNGAAATWSFAGGNTANRDEVLDLYNPSSVTVPITATFYDSNGKMVTRQISLAPTQRSIIAVNTLGLSEYHGAVLQSANGQGFIAEQGISARDSRLLRSTQGLAQ